MQNIIQILFCSNVFNYKKRRKKMIKRKKRDKDKNVETRLHLRIYVHLQLLHDATAHCTRSFVRHKSEF